MADATFPHEPTDPQYGTRQRLEAPFDNFWRKLKAKMKPTASPQISERRKSNTHGGPPSQNPNRATRAYQRKTGERSAYKAAALTNRHPSGLGAHQGLAQCRPYTREDTRDRENPQDPKPTTMSGRLHGHKARALAKARSQRLGKSSHSRNTQTVRRFHYHTRIQTPSKRSNTDLWTLPLSTTYDLWTLPLSTTYASLAGTKNIPTMGVG
ncbi:Hypothetical predicted protein [Pelobates cultripes]|uniref:Uncharacterized protein n=1 Tax=Pelobates cultripes TaxID=61616 RepID=A0AAD1R3G0_PELCU|nr:Hypothetical predicted protein [Pelobates cultripes]